MPQVRVQLFFGIRPLGQKALGVEFSQIERSRRRESFDYAMKSIQHTYFGGRAPAGHLGSPGRAPRFARAFQ
jgi:hypothetical protein